jgi:GT2 family glycosyltransferase
LKLAVVVPATDRPETLGACLAALEDADDAPSQVIVIDEPIGVGAAAARNIGAARADADVIVFVDADVAVHRDVFQRVRTRFGDPTLTAVFGSYDDAPSAHGLVSRFRNLLHHHVHQSAGGPASTFWTGLGAIRMEAFRDIGGLDETLQWLEDVDLGMRLAAVGYRIDLDPEIQGVHLKRWTLWSMVRTDFIGRGVPWMTLLLRHRRPSSALNLGWRHRASAMLAVAVPIGIARRRFGLAALSAAAFVTVNRAFYALLIRRLGISRATAGVGLHLLHHLVAVASVPAGVVAHFTRRRSDRLRRR